MGYAMANAILLTGAVCMQCHYIHVYEDCALWNWNDIIFTNILIAINFNFKAVKLRNFELNDSL